jgi:hypothetical protein
VAHMASPVIQVVTSGTDWPAVWAAISGGAVGLAGIGATVWQFRRGIRADNQRAEVAEKRRIYGRYHASLDNVFALADSVRTASDPDMQRYLSELQDANIEMYSASSELTLVAPRDIAELARNVVRTLSAVCGPASP